MFVFVVVFAAVVVVVVVVRGGGGGVCVHGQARNDKQVRAVASPSTDAA